MDDLLFLIIMFGVGFCTTLLYTPKFIRKATVKGFTVRDMYKRNRPVIPTMGGLAILTGTLASLMVSQFFISSDIANVLLFYFIVFIFALFGLADDLLNIGRPTKIFLPFIMALPIALLTSDTTLWIGFMEVELGLIYPYLVAPVYLMVVANLVNMHSGYNGLSCGLSYIVLLFVSARAFMMNGIPSLYFILPIFGSSLAFLYYNTYPARMFWGNIGSLMVGSAIGGLIILNNMEVFGVVLLTPHIINFLMYVVWKIKRIGDVKFGEIREDGTIRVPNPWTLKWVIPYYFRVTEHQAMWVMYLLTTFFGVLAFILIPY